jgi:hypothetical protein
MTSCRGITLPLPLIVTSSRCKIVRRFVKFYWSLYTENKIIRAGTQPDFEAYRVTHNAAMRFLYAPDYVQNKHLHILGSFKSLYSYSRFSPQNKSSSIWERSQTVYTMSYTHAHIHKRARAVAVILPWTWMSSQQNIIKYVLWQVSFVQPLSIQLTCPTLQPNWARHSPVPLLHRQNLANFTVNF